MATAEQLFFFLMLNSHFNAKPVCFVERRSRVHVDVQRTEVIGGSLGCPRRRTAFPNCIILSAVRPSQSAYPSAKVRLIEFFLYSLDELLVMKMAAKILFYHKIHSSQSSIITSLSAIQFYHKILSSQSPIITSLSAIHFYHKIISSQSSIITSLSAIQF